MKKTILMIFSIFLIGCGSSSSDEIKKTNLREINTIQEAQSAIYGVNQVIYNINNTQNNNFYYSLNDNFYNDILIRKKIKSYSCPFGGEYNYNGDKYLNGSFNFHDCSFDYNSKSNGYIKTSSVKFDNYLKFKIGIFYYKNFATTYKDIKTYARDLQILMDKRNHETYTKYNGNMSISKNNENYNILFHDYEIFSTNELKKINGKIKLNSDKNTCDSNGVYQIKTLLPLKYHDNKINSGEITVNKVNYIYEEDGITIIFNNTRTKIPHDKPLICK